MDTNPFPPVITFTIKVVVCTMAAIAVMSFGALLFGLYRAEVDNKEALAIIGPALIAIISSFGTILGSTGGYIAGKLIGKQEAVAAMAAATETAP